MKIVIAYLPGALPTVMPYSLVNLASAVKARTDAETVVLDLNCEWHESEFPDIYNRLGKEEFFGLMREFVLSHRRRLSEISKETLHGENPYAMKLAERIMREKPDLVALSLVYNSQVMFARDTIAAIVEAGITVVVGGPADMSKLDANKLCSHDELIKLIIEKGARLKEDKPVLDFSDLTGRYFTKETVFPLKSSDGCPWGRCAFCTHHGGQRYRELPIEDIRETIIRNRMRKICLIDDGLPPGRLKKLGEMLSGLDVVWWCQLRPVREMLPLLPTLHASGLRAVAWGVESGCQRVLDKMDKGTRKEDITAVLAESKKAGIINMIFMMAGFPTETREEFQETLQFVRENSDNIDLISTSTFGLQMGSRVMDSPERFGISDITFSKRTILSDSISYTAGIGMSQAEAESLRKKHIKSLRKIDKIPEIINASREQALNL